MLLNVHSWYSLRYGTMSSQSLIKMLVANGYKRAVLTDINNCTGMLEARHIADEQGLNLLAGVEYRDDNELLYIGIAKDTEGFRVLNQWLTDAHLSKNKYPMRGPRDEHVFIVYPLGKVDPEDLAENEFIGVKAGQLNALWRLPFRNPSKFVAWQSATFAVESDITLHRQLRAIDANLLLSQLPGSHTACSDEILLPSKQMQQPFTGYPELIRNAEWLLEQCSFDFNFKAPKNKTSFYKNKQEDKEALTRLAYEGCNARYAGSKDFAEAKLRVQKELGIIEQQGFCSYFLIANDVIQFSTSQGFYHVGRGSGANSVVAYCLRITDVCPIELDLYFERFLNPKRKSPPDFDIDYSWRDRDAVFNYLFKKYGVQHCALLGAMSTFRDRSIIRELGKVYGLPKGEIDQMVNEPRKAAKSNEVSALILNVHEQMSDFPNLRTIHAGGVLITERPISSYCALDLPPKGFPTAQFDMNIAEDIHLEKLDILSQRGIGHINECVSIVKGNQGIDIDVHATATFKKDPKIAAQLRSADTIGCFYIESPAMRGLLSKLHCSDYLTLVAASSIIRPGVAKSGMMRTYISRYHQPDKVEYLHPVMKEQLAETFGVMVYQEDVLKIGHHFGGLDLADADVLRRLMSGKKRGIHHLVEIEGRFFDHCNQKGYPEATSKEVWRQIESFAGYSFSKAHSASYAVESYQSLYLKTYFPLEFMTAVINNYGGFYSTRVYAYELKKAGGALHVPCVNNSEVSTSIIGKEVYLGLQHVERLEQKVRLRMIAEREENGKFEGLENFSQRVGLSLDQLIILIRVGAFRFTGQSKKSLLWMAHALYSGHKPDGSLKLFEKSTKQFELPAFDTSALEHGYDELELLGFTVSVSAFDMLQTSFRGDVLSLELMGKVGETVRMAGDFITAKYVRTVRGETMNFGTFIDVEGHFFDTVHFPPSLQHSPLLGRGIYLIRGKVVEEFGFASVEVERMIKLPLKPDPRWKD